MNRNNLCRCKHHLRGQWSFRARWALGAGRGQSCRRQGRLAAHQAASRLCTALPMAPSKRTAPRKGLAARPPPTPGIMVRSPS